MQRWWIAVLALGCARVEMAEAPPHELDAQVAADDAAVPEIAASNGAVSVADDEPHDRAITVAQHEASFTAMPERVEITARTITEPRLFTTTTEDGQEVLTYEGLPAISADGAHVLAFRQWNDWGGGQLELSSTSTGRVVRLIAWPQELEEEAGPIDVRQQRRIERILARRGFVSLRSLRWEELAPASDDTPAVSRFFDEELEVRGAWREDGEGNPFMSIAVDQGGARVYEGAHDSDALVGAYRLPGASFMLVELQFCACHCATWPALVPIAR
jgi:hypothetical protein